MSSLYIPRCPVLRTAQIALHFTPLQTCSFQGHFNFSGKHLATLQLLREDYSFTYPPLSVLLGSHLYSQRLEATAVGFETEFSRLRVRHSNRYAIAPHIFSLSYVYAFTLPQMIWKMTYLAKYLKLQMTQQY